MWQAGLLHRSEFWRNPTVLGPTCCLFPSPLTFVVARWHFTFHAHFLLTCTHVIHESLAVKPVSRSVCSLDMYTIIATWPLQWLDTTCTWTWLNINIHSHSLRRYISISQNNTVNSAMQCHWRHLLLCYTVSSLLGSLSPIAVLIDIKQAHDVLFSHNSTPRPTWIISLYLPLPNDNILWLHL